MIIDRYLLREVSAPFLGVTAVLMVVFLTYSLTVFLTDASSGLLGGSDVARLTFLKSMVALEVLLPSALFVAVVMAMGRLYSDSEMAALRAAGVSEFRMLRPIFRLALFVAILVGLMSTVIRPWAYAKSYEMKAAAEATSEIDRIRGGRFYSYEDDNRTVFVEHIEGDLDHLEGVFIRSREGRDIEVLSAEGGALTLRAEPDYHRLLLRDASIFKTTVDGPDLFGTFGKFSIRLPVKAPKPVGYKTKTADTLTLYRSDDPDDKAEFQWRISTPISVLLLTILAVPLSRSRPRQGRYAGLVIALLVYALYFNMVTVARTWVEQGSAVSIWWAPGLLALAVLVAYQPWGQWLARLRRKRQHATA